MHGEEEAQELKNKLALQGRKAVVIECGLELKKIFTLEELASCLRVVTDPKTIIEWRGTDIYVYVDNKQNVTMGTRNDFVKKFGEEWMKKWVET